MAKADPPADINAILDKLDAFLHTKQLKLTAQRRQIVEKILEMPRHFTADDLVDSFIGQRPRVSKATIYRALSVMVEGGILEIHDFGEGHRLFELAIGRTHHDHLCCTRCGKIIEFFSEEMETLQERISDRLGFHPTSHSQKIYGICRECWRKEGRG